MSNNDFEKANILHQLLSNFDVTQEMMDALKAQIIEPQVSQNLDRIFAGLDVEDSYYYVAAPLPWVKNIHPLHQLQERKHKETYQVPDYSLMVENAQEEDFPLLVDVKSTRVEKGTCKLIPAQIQTLLNYAHNNNKVLLIAIFWEKHNYWTHNTVEHFRSNGKISFADAFANDLSHILSDYLFLFTRSFYRKSYFTTTFNENLPQHEVYGSIKSTYLGFDLDDLEEIKIYESAVIDSAFTLEEIEVGNDSNGKYLIEKFELPAGRFGQFIRTSTWIRKLLEYIGIPLDQRHSIKDGDITRYELTADTIRVWIVEMSKRLKGEVQYPEPKDKNPTTDKLYQLAYKDTEVHRMYLSSDSEEYTKKVVF